ncbi:MAG: hypothetical protein C1943_05285 [Halochromatium sp.]|nr:hypothetical protein [Halochromatium sp.]
MFGPLDRWLFVLIATLGLLLSSLSAQADEFCVDSAAGLQTALTTAAYNDVDDRIQLVQGTYNGNFSYPSLKADDLELIGGYVSGCENRTQDPANTVLDGGGTNTALVLVARGLDAAFNIDGVTLQNGVRTSGEQDGGGLFSENSGSVSLVQTVVANNRAGAEGGGAYIVSGQVTLETNVFTGNEAAGTGGGAIIYADRADLTGNRFVTNTGDYAGGLHLNQVKTAALNGNEFSQNTASRDGGGAYLYDLETAYLTENRFTDNVSELAAGGGVFINNQYDPYNGLIHLTRNEFSGNAAQTFGGAAYLVSYYSNDRDIVLTENEFSSNTAQGDAGGVYFNLYRSNVNLAKNAFSNNSSQASGGAVYIRVPVSINHLVEVVNNVLIDNDAELSGGGIVVDVSQPSRISLLNNVLFGNVAGSATSTDGLGGGLLLSTIEGTLSLTNNSIVQNRAPKGGGVALQLTSAGASVGGVLLNNLFWANQGSPGQDLWINNDFDDDFNLYPLTLGYNNFDQTLVSGINMTLPILINPSNYDAINPLFVDLAQGDLSLSNGSPMINAGDPDTRGLPAADVAGQPRLVGQIVDIGAYENPTGDPSLAELNVGLEGNGSGTLTSEPAGIDCGLECNAVFAAGTEVTLTATPDSAMMFAGWSGACSGTEPTCTLILNEATIVIAHFEQGYPITPQITPSGAGTVTCEPNPVLSGGDSLCTARPASGYGFVAWSSDCTSTDNQRCTLTNIIGNQSVTAEFTATADLSASQAVSDPYNPGGLLTVTAQFNDTSGAEARNLTWFPELPSGWTLISATGDGAPQVANGEILFTGTLSLPIDFSYQVRVPERARGDQQLAATLSYQSTEITNPITLLAEPDPLPVAQIEIDRHSADYQDPAWSIDGTEAGRVLAYWRARAYHIDPAGVDQYNEGEGDTDGERHSADYLEPWWSIDTFEANRVLGYWRAPSYYYEPLGDDHYAPGSEQPARAMSRSLTEPFTEADSPSALQSASVGFYTPGTTLTITNTLGRSGDDPLLALVWVPSLPQGWILDSVSGAGAPEISPSGAEILFTTSETLSLPLTFSYSVQVPASASGPQRIAAEFTYQRLGMINTDSAPVTPNPLVLSDTDTGGDCSPGEVVLINPVTGSQTQRSEVSIQVAGTVTVASGAALELTAPRILFAPGFSVERGGRLQATAAAVNCTATSSTAAQGQPFASSNRSEPGTAAEPFTAAAEPMTAAPSYIASAEALPLWLQARLAEFKIDTDSEALTSGLLDADERWLILQTTQALHAADSNGVSDLYRLDLLSDQLELISVTESGQAGNGASVDASADRLGERVVFSSVASDLVPSSGNGNDISHLFLRDLALGVTERLTHSDQTSAHPAMDQQASVLLYDQTQQDGGRQILGQALTEGAAAAVVPLSDGDPGTDAHHPALSADGRFLAYLSQGRALEHSTAEPGTEVAICEIVWQDVVTGQVQRQPCPATLIKAGTSVRAIFSADAGALSWYATGQPEPMVLLNPFADALSRH